MHRAGFLATNLQTLITTSKTVRVGILISTDGETSGQSGSTSNAAEEINNNGNKGEPATKNGDDKDSCSCR